MRPTRVLVVDDSPLVRKTVRQLVNEDPRLRVVGVAADGVEALELTEKLKPDVVSLDLHMPVMDGMTCLGHLIRRYRQRVVILSTLAKENAFPTFKSLALGAIDFVTKPGAGLYLDGIDELGEELRRKIHQAAAVSQEKIGRPRALSKPTRPSAAALPARPTARVIAFPRRLEGIVGIGGSTGGAVALESILRDLPAETSLAVVAVQHIPRGFSRDFARYLNRLCPLPVREAKDGDSVHPGMVYLAPGGEHLRLQRKLGGFVLRTDNQLDPRYRLRPSISLFLYSLAIGMRHRALGILLSGMGEDGVHGLEAVRRLGGRTMVQDEKSSVIFGIGARAVERGVVDRVVPLTGMAAAIEGSFGGVPSIPLRGGVPSIPLWGSVPSIPLRGGVPSSGVPSSGVPSAPWRNPRRGR